MSKKKLNHHKRSCEPSRTKGLKHYQATRSGGKKNNKSTKNYE